MKAKTVTNLVKPGKFAKAVSEKARNKVEIDIDEDEVAPLMKRPGMATTKRKAASQEESAPVKKVKTSDKKSDEKLVAERKKELKGMPAADLKELVTSKGLEKGNK